MGLKLDDNPPKREIKYPIRAKYTNPNYRSICQVMRDIYNKTDDPEIHDLLNEAHDMAHRMGHKLLENYNMRMAELIYETKEEEINSVK